MIALPDRTCFNINELGAGYVEISRTSTQRYEVSISIKGQMLGGPSLCCTSYLNTIMHNLRF